ncbi:MAG: PLDc N-terminal domain-containing protein [Defluviitaleaceae bacterium]|nr:PLDc N-terminal domain-containing protein [Defluviitaleaceae bacterium]
MDFSFIVGAFHETIFADFEYAWEMHRTLMLAMIPVMILQIGLVVAAIGSIAKKGDAPATDRIIWVLVTGLVSIIGPVIYFAVGAKMLDEKATQNIYNES